jgi:cell division septation protein DedD
MQDIDDEKTRILEQGPDFFHEDPEDFGEIEEEIWEEGNGSRWSRRSFLLVGLLCVGLGVLILAVFLFRKPVVKRPQFVGERIRARITSIEKKEEQGISKDIGKGEGLSQADISEQEKMASSEPSKPSTVMEEREVNSKKIVVFGEKETEEGKKKVTEETLEVKTSEIEGKEERRQQRAKVEEPKGAVISEEARPERGYTVNMASFRRMDEAERFVKDLEEKGLEAFIERTDLPQKGIWYRVAVGRFSSRDEALDFARGLKERGIDYSFVRRVKEAER